MIITFSEAVLCSGFIADITWMKCRLRAAHLARAAKQEAGDGLLDLLAAEDLRRDAAEQVGDRVRPRRKLPELSLLLLPARMSM